MEFNIGLAVGIVVIVYIIIELLKRFVTKTDKQQDMLPFAGIIIGAILAIAVYFLDSAGTLGIEVGDNLLTAIVTGAASGLVATGGNQIYKKIRRLLDDDYDSSSDTALDEAEEVIEKVEDIIDDITDKKDE